ncbi:hypothetical protein RN001_012184 [Aquatica leii]|uniref:Uncharacterized protein n=1 Tax=Aquatica leii TaxID=1421715 RepID=A0AAN7SD66_9COLE|nr:hypothetical protein RN001_012184 [Aquatica leii]
MEVEDDMFLDDDVDILDIIEYGFPRRIYIRSDYFHNMDDLTFLRRFRLTKPTVLAILAQIEGQLEFNNDLNNSISPSHIRTRNVLERVFGVSKRRFLVEMVILSDRILFIIILHIYSFLFI